MLILIATLLTSLGINHLDSGSNAQLQKKDPLKVFQWKNRLLIFFDETDEHIWATKRIKSIRKRKKEIEDRDMLVITVTPSGSFNIFDEKVVELPFHYILEKFKLKPASHYILLIGKDGNLKLKDSPYLDLDKVFTLIDSMPMRKAEIRSRRKGP